jgi:hypothetical protein
MRSLHEDWEYNVLDVYNHHKDGPYRKYYEFVVENHAILDEDICEVGVFKGRTLLAMAILLKELGSNKKVWGFDSFSGFPSYHENDDLGKFDELYQSGQIDDEHHRKVHLNLEYRALHLSQRLTAANISSSGDFSKTSLDILRQKIDYLQLDNIELVQGSFQDSMKLEYAKDYPKFSAVLMDCDLYESYKFALPFVWENLKQGGYIFLDEYYSLKFPGARIACKEFFAGTPDKPQMHQQIPGDFQRWYVRKIFSNK